MLKEMLIQKLTSRKFWAAATGFVTPLLLAYGFSEELTAHITATITAGATLIAYIYGESLVDANRQIEIEEEE